MNEYIIWILLDPGLNFMDEVEDPKPILEEKCRQSAPCQPYLQALQACSQRVESTPDSGETCAQELGDLLHCSDQCVRNE